MRLKDKLLKVIDTEQASRSDDVAKAIQSLQDVTDDNVLGVDMALMGDVQAGPNSPEPSVPSTYNRLANSTWRLFEEQRMHALETAQECDAIIKAAEARRDDALRTVDMCVAAQKIGERV